MKRKYYVHTKAQSNGDHEVHTADCNHLPAAENSIYLGDFVFCREAVGKAKKLYGQVNGCYYCCQPCHFQ